MVDDKMIEMVKKRLVDAYDPLAIYIFGSYAWGHPDEESDLDLMVVIDEYKKKRHATLVDGHRALMDLDLFKDIIIYSKEEFVECSQDVTSLCNKIVKKGKQIYAKA